MKDADRNGTGPHPTVSDEPEIITMERVRRELVDLNQGMTDLNSRMTRLERRLAGAALAAFVVAELVLRLAERFL